jgi:hypothetical protein
MAPHCTLAALQVVVNQIVLGYRGESRAAEKEREEKESRGERRAGGGRQR